MKEIWLFSERRLFSLKTLFATQGRTLIQRSPMSECQGFEEFETRFGQDAAAELLERICDASWSQSKKPPTPGLVLTSVHEHNAANHTLCGHIEHGGEVFHFVIDNGDWAGTVVREFGPEDRVPEYEPLRLRNICSFLATTAWRPAALASIGCTWPGRRKRGSRKSSRRTTTTAVFNLDTPSSSITRSGPTPRA